ncbi:hypothetical protein ARAM_000269 [Aspergillus rambellii]|uniref:RING-type domain-containing protein n=1 Tax=Aspergillus rambellii TaxID=308745 RepID=A0A0F8XA76_9EURO|nr:hypothetical protein ARAM_000269 [Aspergillus rambellii]
MGQSSSTQRDQRQNTPFHHLTSLQRSHSRRRNEDMSTGQNTEQDGVVGPQEGLEINNDDVGMVDQMMAPVDPWQPTITPGELSGNSRQMGRIQEETGSQYEPIQREYRSAILARMAARRHSTMSRLGSRILPNSVIRGLLSSEEETPAEGHAHRHGIVSRSIPRSEIGHSSSRFSPFTSLSARGVSRRRSIRAPYFIPRSDPSVISDPNHSGSSLDPSAENSPESGRVSWRRNARLHRMRQSLSSPITQMFGQPSSGTSPDQTPEDTQQPHMPGPDSLGFIPHPVPMDTRPDFDAPHELDSVEPAVGSPRPGSPLFPQSAQSPSSARHFPSLLRARPSRALRREEQTPLSRVLQLAAAAIAAQLSGTAGPVMPNIQALGNDGLDGSLESFIQSLQHATSGHPTPSDASNSTGDDGPPAPVNFLRVFRFANSDSPRAPGPSNPSTTESDNSGNHGDGIDVDNHVDGPEGRTVTLVVVGVRSVPSGNGPGGDQQPTTGPGLDALLRLPFLTPGNIPRNQDSGPGFPPRAGGRPGFAANRPTAGSAGAPIINDETPSQQGLSSPSRRFSDAGSRGPPSSLPSVVSESPPGPHPPPSTPAEPGLSAVSSGASTPSRRLSSASMMSPNILPQLDENRSMQPTVEPLEDNIPFTTSRQRRRSDSEFARHRELGSGAVRRNGVVEPDNPTPPAGRSWLIYVVGTNLSENHPAFATPSLFTDNPTYEDMILLSSLLGPAKPPVASQEDLTSAGGLLRVIEYGGSLVAQTLDEAVTIPIPERERCLICLSDYEVAEELRQLTKCKHLYHRDCIDQWLTTGRNSCPLCRGQGVAEKSNAEASSDPPSAAAA